MAAAAPVAGAVVQAGVAAYDASQKKSAAGDISGMKEAPVTTWERLFNRGTLNVLQTQRRVLADALQQSNVMQPEIYRALGFEPQFDTSSQPDLAGHQAKVDALQGQFEAAKGPKKAKLRQQLNMAEENLTKAQSVPQRLIGLTKIDPRVAADPAHPTTDNLAALAVDLQARSLVAALKGEEPIDSTLQDQWTIAERSTRAKLRASLGPDYETTTAGQSALANFSRQKAQAFEEFNRQTVKDMSTMVQAGRESQSNLTAARIQQLQTPAAIGKGNAAALGSEAADRLKLSNQMQQDRQITNQFNETKMGALGNIYSSGGAGSGAAGAIASGAGAALQNPKVAESLGNAATGVGNWFSGTTANDKLWAQADTTGGGNGGAYGFLK